MSLPNNEGEIVNGDESASVAPQKKKHKTLRRVLLIVLAVFVLLIIAVATAWLVMYHQGEQALVGGNQSAVIELPSAQNIQPEEQGRLVTYNGARYRYNEAITTMLCLGIDKSELGTENGVIGTGGQADAIYLLALNTQTNKHKVIGISRDAVTDVGVYSEGGKYLRTEPMQLCLSFAYGDGRHSSCTNTLNAVQRLFYNIPIQQYYAIDIEAIAVLNDCIGGVTVPEYDEQGKKTGSEITLYGDAAEKYVRERDLAKLSSNNDRMQRQLDYISAFAGKLVRGARSNFGLPLELFNISSQYSSTNITASNVTYLSTTLLSKGGFSLDFLNVGGRVVEGEGGYAEFEVDRQQLLELVLSVFYEPVE